MHRVHRWLPIMSALALLGFAVVVAADAGIAQADHKRGGGALAAEPYREGPLDRREPIASVSWPRGSRELLALGLIAAILCGFRASGLAQSQPSARSPR